MNDCFNYRDKISCMYQFFVYDAYKSKARKYGRETAACFSGRLWGEILRCARFLALAHLVQALYGLGKVKKCTFGIPSFDIGWMVYVVYL